MLWMLLIGWIVLLPAIVVGGLYVSASVLGRRRAALHAYEESFADEEGSEPTHELWAVEAGRMIPARPAPVPSDAGVNAAPLDAAAADRPRVAAADRARVAARY